MDSNETHNAWVCYVRMEDGKFDYESFYNSETCFKRIDGSDYYTFNRPLGCEIPTRAELNKYGRLLHGSEYDRWNDELRAIESWLLVHSDPVHKTP